MSKTGTPVFPIRVTINVFTGTECSTTDVIYTATHVNMIDEVLQVFDGVELLEQYASGTYESYSIEEVIPEIEEYKGEGFPL